MAESLPPERPPPPSPDPGRYDQVEFAPRKEPPAPMNPLLKGCLIAIFVPLVLLFLLVSACFGLSLIF